MKNILKLLVVAVFTAFFTSCGYLAQKQNPQKYSKAITADGVKPLHIGSVTPAKSGAYHVQMYQQSRIFMSTTGLVRPAQVEVFDLDHNGAFDVVYTYQDGVWSIGFTRKFTSEYKVINNSLSQKTVREWIKKATSLKRPSFTSSPITKIQQPTSPQPVKIEKGIWVVPH